jgi:hypothetical protein
MAQTSTELASLHSSPIYFNFCRSVVRFSFSLLSFFLSSSSAAYSGKSIKLRLQFSSERGEIKINMKKKSKSPREEERKKIIRASELLFDFFMKINFLLPPFSLAARFNLSSMFLFHLSSYFMYEATTINPICVSMGLVGGGGSRNNKKPKTNFPGIFPTTLDGSATGNTIKSSSYAFVNSFFSIFFVQNKISAFSLLLKLMSELRAERAITDFHVRTQ